MPVPKMSFRFVPRCWRRKDDWIPNTSANASSSHAAPPATFASLVPGRCPGVVCVTANEVAAMSHSVTHSALNWLAREGFHSVQVALRPPTFPLYLTVGVLIPHTHSPPMPA